MKETGWTLEYVDALSVADMNEWLASERRHEQSEKDAGEIIWQYK